MRLNHRARFLLVAAFLITVVGALVGAQSQGSVKIGLIAEFSGPFQTIGKNIQNGMLTYLKMHGETFGGRKIEIIARDTTGPAPAVAKRLAQELLTNDKVDFLAGFGLTPNAMSVAPLATEAKIPMIIMNATS